MRGWIEGAKEWSSIFAKEEFLWSLKFDADVAGQVPVEMSVWYQIRKYEDTDLSEQEKSALMPLEDAVRPPASPTK